ncbi:MAG TPA: class I SAM-dependent methyltransferase [Bryobacteraceae bacterium]|nr:class I SAM-dependent methyltransferase [Bryobacteraceae bacterium]
MQRHRDHFLCAAQKAHSALVLGDGDGRFLERLITLNSSVVVDSIEASHKMAVLARRRIDHRLANSDSLRVRILEGDARRIDFPMKSYDLIATHFFLDCFNESELVQLTDRLAHHAAPRALWIISEFRKPTVFFEAIHAKVWLKIMYTFFRLVAKLEVEDLPDHRGILTANRFTLIDQHLSFLSFVGSELWQFGPLPE